MNKQQLLSEATKYNTAKYSIMQQAEQFAELWIELIEAHRVADEADANSYIALMWERADEGKVYEYIIGVLCKQLILAGDHVAALSPERQREFWAFRVDYAINERLEHFRVMLASLRPDGTRDIEAERWSLS